MRCLVTHCNVKLEIRRKHVKLGIFVRTHGDRVTPSVTHRIEMPGIQEVVSAIYKRFQTKSLLEHTIAANVAWFYLPSKERPAKESRLK